MDIIAELKHPEIQGPPLERGVRYGHHFVVELISDGRRLWAVASEEGRKVLNEIERGLTGDEPPVKRGPTVAEWVEAGYSAKHYPPAPYASCSTDEEIAAAIEAQENADGVGNRSGSSTEPVQNQIDPADIDPNTAPASVTALDPNGSPATGGAPQPIGGDPAGAAPTTTTSPANSFDS